MMRERFTWLSFELARMYLEEISVVDNREIPSCMSILLNKESAAMLALAPNIMLLILRSGVI